MSITDELRSWAEGNALRAGMSLRTARDKALAIADRIDAEHEKAIASVMNDALYFANEKDMAELGWIRLPVDANGQYIRIGDTVTCGATVWTVTGLKFLGEGWGVCCTVYNECGGSGTSVYPPSNLRHYHATTVEDVMVDFAIGWECAQDGEDKTAVLKEYAAKLQLRGDAE